MRILNETDGDPTVRLTPTLSQTAPLILPATSFAECTPLPNTQRSLESCKQLLVTLTQAQFATASVSGEVYNVGVLLPRQADAQPPGESPTKQLAVLPKVCACPSAPN